MTTTRIRLGAAAMLIAAATTLTACATDDGPTNTTLGDTSVTSPAPSSDPEAAASEAADASADAAASSESAAPSSDADDVPPPADATTLTCADYQTRDEPTQVAIVKANGVTKNPFLVATLVKLTCMKQPEQTVAAVIGGMRSEIIHK